MFFHNLFILAVEKNKILFYNYDKHKVDHYHMSQSIGFKAKAKEFLRSKGVKTIRVGSKFSAYFI